jgi:hypothetical protein
LRGAILDNPVVDGVHDYVKGKYIAGGLLTLGGGAYGMLRDPAPIADHAGPALTNEEIALLSAGGLATGLGAYGLYKNSKDNHVEQRRKERAKHVSKKQISKLKDAIEAKQKKIPEGSHHVKLDNAYGILKDVGDKHVLATIYGPNMKPPGKDLTGAVLKRHTALDALGLGLDVVL